MKQAIEALKLYFKSLSLFWRASPLIAILLILLIPIQAVVPSILIWLGQYLIDTVTNAKFITGYLISWAIVFFLGNLVTPVMTTFQGVLTDRLISTMNISLMEKSKDLKGLRAFENSSFYDDLQIISSEASWRPVNLIVFGINILRNVITSLSMAFLLAKYNPLIALLILASVIPQSIITYKVQQESFETMVTLSPDSRRMQYYSDLLLTKYAAKEIRIFNLFDFFIDKYRQTFQSIHGDISNKRYKKMIASIIFISLGSMVSIVSLFWFIQSIRRGQIQIGALLTFTTSIIYINQSLSSLVEESSMLYDTLLYMKKYFTFMDMKPDVSNRGSEAVKDLSEISFHDVSFTYQGNEEKALDSITFHVNSGEKIAIVGENGAGKTTLIKLLLRFYDIDSGRIESDGKDILTYDIQQYRSSFSAVFQDFAHFSLSIKDNIVMSNLSEKDNIKRMVHAAEESGIDKVMAHKNIDYDKILGKEYTEGIELSGGEWQKLAITKAYFSGKKFLILDEPTAALDPRSEYEMFRNFLNLTEDKTVLFITHRLAAVKLSDKVLVLKEGKIHGFDTHENLMKANQYYRELYTMQASGYYEGEAMPQPTVEVQG